MAARPGSPEVSPDCLEVVEEFVRPLPDAELVILRIQLRVLQERLGTPNEQPCDLDRIRVLGHEINHRLTAGNPRRDLPRLDDGVEPFSN